MKATQRIIYFILAAALLFAMTACATSQPAVTPAEVQMQAVPQKPVPYVIHPGDQLDIKFFYNPELNESVVVRPDGKISLQLIDEIQASGLQPSELDQKLTAIAKQRGVTKSNLVREVIRHFLSEDELASEARRQSLLVSNQEGEEETLEFIESLADLDDWQ